MKNANVNLDLPILNGSLTTATAKCGIPTCRCHTNKKYWHGPYYRWTGVMEGKRTTVTLSGKQIQECEKAIKNYQKLKETEQKLIHKSMKWIKKIPRD